MWLEPSITRPAACHLYQHFAATRSGAEAKKAELDQTVKAQITLQFAETVFWAVAEGIVLPAWLGGEGMEGRFKNDPDSRQADWLVFTACSAPSYAFGSSAWSCRL